EGYDSTKDRSLLGADFAGFHRFITIYADFAHDIVVSVSAAATRRVDGRLHGHGVVTFVQNNAAQSDFVSTDGQSLLTVLLTVNKRFHVGVGRSTVVDTADTFDSDIDCRIIFFDFELEEELGA